MSDIKRKRGDTYANELTVKKGGEPFNITGCTFKLTVTSIAVPPDESTKLFHINGTIIDAANGRVEFAPLAADVDRVGTCYYDIEMVDGAGRKRTIKEGKYIFTQDRGK